MKQNKWNLWPEVLLLIVCVVWLSCGISQKEGYHMDELLSFELANAKFNPWIVPTQPQGRLAKYVEREIEGENVIETIRNLKETAWDVMQNKGSSKLLSYKADVYAEPVWISGQQFLDYITVGKRDAFAYLSVYFNVKDDNHPPLHFMLLHTVSSLFWGKISPFLGCSINLVCVAGIMVLFMYLGRILCLILDQRDKGRLVGFWMAAAYGFSPAAMCTTLLIRMYGMLSFWCLALLVIHIGKFYAPRLKSEYPESGERADFSKKNRLLIAVTVCGFLTQYFFLFYCLILAAVTAFLLWREGREKEAVCYTRSMMTAAVIGLVCFPFAIPDVFSSGRGVEALSNLSMGLTGYGTRLKSFAKILVQELGVVTVLFVGVVVACGIVLCAVKRKGVFSLKLTCLLILPTVGYFMLAARMSPYLVDRYIMPVFPLVVLLPVLAVSCFGGRGLWWGMIAATLLLQPIQTLRYDNPYLYRGYKAQLQISIQYADAPCICIGEGVGYYENLVEFAHYDRTLLLTPQEFAGHPDSIGGLSNAVVLLKPGVERENVCKEMEQYYRMTLDTVLLSEGSAHGDEILYFRAMTP